ncbi:TetR/AcrR family transcriptional regulator [Streptomyces sp. PSKA30]|uniref:TetR/AcrR family transcriptional regulator n=1 Tax=Streptomyces sp. PSKA30 TaxID=2874597 RepID=UPI001CD171E3|nr:TetR/AcrR family transcriptional regulator C-terminal domain-containing protein [Streptomyces sp. PSKA30]MBZ9638918.1 TetR/AcrR family transcriptional regulator C-terminal domain-containing protein [Streptomyces sp. PSKA30]
MGVIVSKPRSSGRASSGAAQSVWLRRPPTPRNEPPLSRERITEAAIALLDEEGMERLTMRHLAERLGVGATTLYWHIDTKDDVIDLAIDAIFAEAPLPEGDAGSWQENVVALLSGCRAMLLRHPWSAALPLRRRPSIGPNFLTWLEFLQATLARAGLEGRQVQAACWVLYNHVQGSTASQSSLRWSGAERTAAQEQLRMQQEQYPTLVEYEYMLDDAWDENFELGLKYVLDGLQAQIAASR